MSFNVIRGPAAFTTSFLGAGEGNGHVYWIGFASGNRSTWRRRKTADKALEDAEKLERKYHSRKEDI